MPPLSISGSGVVLICSPALKFASLYILISIVSKGALTLFGQSGFLVATGLGALIGLDAVMINTAQLAGDTISITIAVVAFILANGVNLLGKSVYSFLQGERSFAMKFSFSMLLLIGTSLLGLLFIPQELLLS